MPLNKSCSSIACSSHFKCFFSFPGVSGLLLDLSEDAPGSATADESGGAATAVASPPTALPLTPPPPLDAAAAAEVDVEIWKCGSFLRIGFTLLLLAMIMIVGSLLSIYRLICGGGRR